MESALDYWSAKALLDWQVELGATDALCDTPVDRYALEERQPKAKAPAKGEAPQVVKPKEADPVAEAQKAARASTGLPSLRESLAAFEHCELKKGARNLVFSDGQPGARVMIIGEAPGREDDREGKPFSGRAGDLLDKMLEAIGLSRAENAYLTNVLPWRPQQNRDLLPAEIAMMRPFLQRHVELAKPDVLVLMGNIACEAVLGKRGLTRMRGKWDQAWGKPVLPMFTPEDLLRRPQQKRLAWADLLEVKAKLGSVN